MRKIINLILYPFILLKGLLTKKKTIQTLTFVKEDSVWYIDLPDWELSRDNLRMIAGADTLLDELSENVDRITCIVEVISISWPSDLSKTHVFLSLADIDVGGVSGSYKAWSKYPTKNVWLCPVVSYVFGGLPQYLTITKIG